MPFTPFHMGPGIAIKAILQGSFSLMVFGWSQIVMDLQPLWVLLSGHGRLHGVSHTFTGATLLALLSAITGKYLAAPGLAMIGIAAKSKPVEITWRVALLSAFTGCFSHVLLDAIMHPDMRPFYPWSADNGLLGILSIDNLHRLCLCSGLLGAALFYGICWHKRGA